MWKPVVTSVMALLLSGAPVWAEGAAPGSAADAGFDVAESRFIVFIANEDGTETSFDSTIVPRIADRSCFYWYLRLEPAPAGDVKYTEHYRLPAPAEFTDENGDAPPDSIISEAGDAIEMKMVQTPEDGWISHGWCLTAGDPLGHYSIEVVSRGETLEVFDFEVVAEEDFDMPDLPPDAPAKEKSENRTNV